MKHKRCEACGSTEVVTRHHVYPTSLREIWRGKVKQKMAPLCRLCHDVVHTPHRLRDLRWLVRRERSNSLWPEYLWRFSNREVQRVLGPYRRIIKVLLTESRVLHLEQA